jgi:branched-chain amino acid transport system substrate-binding protein
VWLAGLNGGGPLPGPSSSPGTSGAGSSTQGNILQASGAVEIAVALQGEGSAISSGILHGIDLALTDARHQAGSWQVPEPTIVMYDHGMPAEGTANMGSIVAQDKVVAVVGPQSSGVARSQIPISNRAGLLQCSPSTASDSLTKPPGGPALRSSRPSDINFVRTVTTNAADAPAAAQYILDNLRKTRVFVVDDGVDSAIVRKKLFTDYFTANGGAVAGEASLKDRDIASIVALANRKNPDVFYFSGSSTAQRAMTEFFVASRKDFGTLPYLMSGEILTGSTFHSGAGPKASTNVFTFVAAADDFLGSTMFKTSYNAAFGVGPEPYSATAYACAAVILDALKRVGPSTNPLDLREKVRAAAVDPSRRYETVLGSFQFDANGDTSQQIVTVYRYDPKSDKFRVEGFVDLGS